MQWVAQLSEIPLKTCPEEHLPRDQTIASFMASLPLGYKIDSTIYNKLSDRLLHKSPTISKRFSSRLHVKEKHEQCNVDKHTMHGFDLFHEKPFLFPFGIRFPMKLHIQSVLWNSRNHDLSLSSLLTYLLHSRCIHLRHQPRRWFVLRHSFAASQISRALRKIHQTIPCLHMPSSLVVVLLLFVHVRRCADKNPSTIHHEIETMEWKLDCNLQKDSLRRKYRCLSSGSSSSCSSFDLDAIAKH